jgi:hypothetical protein
MVYISVCSQLRYRFGKWLCVCMCISKCIIETDSFEEYRVVPRKKMPVRKGCFLETGLSRAVLPNCVRFCFFLALIFETES